MNCPQARFLLYAYMDRELTRCDAEALSRHLGVCAPCATRAESARGLARVLRSHLDRAPAPAGLRSRLHSSLTSNQPMRPRVSSYLFAAAVVLMIVPLVAYTPSPRTASASAASPASALASETTPFSLVSKRMTGTFVCVQCEGRQESGLCPIPESSHVPGFCADNGEIWRLMTRDPGFSDAPLGRTATLEGTAFPESGFLRANRVGY
jgi:anti-sigma factor (TIGR02949 family)